MENNCNAIKDIITFDDKAHLKTKMNNRAL